MSQLTEMKPKWIFWMEPKAPKCLQTSWSSPVESSLSVCLAQKVATCLYTGYLLFRCILLRKDVRGKF